MDGYSVMAALPVCHILGVKLVIPLLLTLVNSATTGKPESCAVSNNGKQTWNWMEVLPGIGWDNLHNKDISLVFKYKYTQCQLTNDRKFL